MNKKKKLLLAYLSIIFIKITFSNFSLNSVLSLSTVYNFMAWFLGGFIGWNLLLVDQFVWVYFTHPEENLSFNTKHFIEKGNYLKAIRYLLQNKDKQNHLAFRNLYFQIAWLVLALFTITTTITLFGKALVMAVGLHLLLDQWFSYKEKGHFDWLFWQLNKKLAQDGQKAYLYLITSLFAIFSLML